MYIQRYIPHLPAAGEVVLFDRSWYNRAGVERVMGFATEEQVDSFLRSRRRWSGPSSTPASSWSSTGWKSAWRSRPSASRSASTTPARSGSSARWTWRRTAAGTTSRGPATPCSRPPTPPRAPWYVVDANDQRRARLNCIAHLLSLIPYEEVPREKVKLPKRQPEGRLRRADYPFRRVPQTYWDPDGASRGGSEMNTAVSEPTAAPATDPANAWYDLARRKSRRSCRLTSRGA